MIHDPDGQSTHYTERARIDHVFCLKLYKETCQVQNTTNAENVVIFKHILGDKKTDKRG